MPTRTAVVSVAVNGYALVYPGCASSHRRYVRRHDCHLVRLTARKFRVDRADAAWLKLDLLAAALRNDNEWVLMIDADAIITSRAPALDTVADGDGDVFAVRGASGRWNSGVLIVRNTSSSRDLVDGIVASRGTPVHEDHWKGWDDWGENGHVIHALDQYPNVRELGLEWNNSLEPRLADFVRHQTGPLARRPSSLDRQRRKLIRKVVSRRPALSVLHPDSHQRAATMVSEVIG